MEDSVYLTYRKSITDAFSWGNIHTFKSNGDYTYVLEHVGQDHGNEYYRLIKSEFSIEDDKIGDFCRLNDSFGNPTKYFIPGCNIRVSPTSLRYIYHTCLILEHIRSLDLTDLNIVEVGAGYGGLALCMNFFGSDRIRSYTCIDLPEALQLQELYLSKFQMKFPVSFVPCSTFGSSMDSTNLFMISNYCFSEISDTNRAKYSEILIPKVQHGFIVWNAIDVYDFGKGSVRVVDERPLTDNKNKYVYF
jgi:hypothetical protein